jgi:hypothetical protein
MEPPQHGGKLLGSGVHGCTFEPAPRCAGGNVFKTINGLPAVGKITSEDPTDELRFGREIMALPLARQYFAVPTVNCRPAEPVADPDSHRCDVILDADEAGERLHMLIMPAAGQTIGAWAKDLPRLASQFQRIFIHLLEGATIYQRAGIVHNDIHTGNVLVDALDVARYIDFGLSFQPASVQKWDDTGISRRFHVRTLWQPPEVYAVRMLLSGVDVSTGVRQLMTMSSTYDKMEHMFPGRKTLAQVIASVHAFVRRHGEAALVRRYAKQFDAWRIGLMFWMFWYDLMSWSGFMATDVYKQRDIYRRVIGGLTDFDPQTRLTVSAALRLLDPTNRLAEAY